MIGFIAVWLVIFVHAYAIENMGFWWSVTVSLVLTLGLTVLYWFVGWVLYF